MLVLRNGFTVTGHSVHGVASPASADNVNFGVGFRSARAHAIDQMWSLLWCRLRDQMAADAVPSTRT